MTAAPLNVLLVEDDEDDFVMTRDLLAESVATHFELEWISTYDEGRGAIIEQRHDVCLLDYRLGDRTGIEMLQEIAALDCVTPIILLTGQGGDEIDAEAMAAGAADYLVKGQIDADVLERTIRHALSRAATLAELRKSEASLAHAQRLAHVGNWEADIATGKVFWSDEMFRMFGDDAKTFDGTLEAFYDFVHPDDRAYVRDVMERTGRGDLRSYTLMYRAVRPDGQERFIHGIGELISDPAGAPVTITGTTQDITDRQRAEALATRLGRTLDESFNEIYVFDAESLLFLQANRGARENLGYRMEELADLTPVDLLPEFTEHRFAKFVDSLRTGERSQLIFESTHRRRDRSTYAVEVRLQLSRSETPPVFVAIVQDITERKAAEEATRRQAQVIDQVNDSVVTVDLDNRITSWNKGAERIFGYSTGEAMGQSVLFVVPEEDRDLMRNEVIPEFERSGSLERDARLLRKSGESFYGHLSMSLLRDSAGAVIGRITCCVDITDRKRAEEALKQAHDDLERRVEERTAELSQTNQTLKQREAELLAAKDQAEEASQVKSDFLATMSHEIRTPMNGVIGMAGLLIDTNLDEEQRRYASAVRDSGEALLSIINDILDFSKLEAGKLDLEIIDFEIKHVVDSVADLLAPRAHAKGIELAAFVAPGVPASLRGDPGRMRQILINLVGNAIKFTETGGVSIEASAERQLDGVVTVRFEIHDTGIGIAKKPQSELFQRFTQADSSTTRRYGGSGLGLAICKQLTGLMGGEIGVESTPGEGSTFWFVVPLEQQGSAPRSPRQADPDLSNLRVLVVDDNEIDRRIFCKQISSWGVEVEAVADGESGLAALAEAQQQRRPFDVAVIDYLMQDTNGTELGRRIRERPEHAGTALVLASSGNLRGDAAKAREIGFDAYLTKPVPQSLLFDCLAELRGPKSGASGGDPETKPLVTSHSIAETRGGPLRVLLAEDNHVNQMVAVAMLVKEGHRVDVVANGIEAVEAVRERPYDLVLMDVHMPEMDGVEATRKIRELHDEVRGIPIIAMTANAMKGDREKYLSVGMDDYISKPVDKAKLVAVIARWGGVGAAMPKGDSPVPADDGADETDTIYGKDSDMGESGIKPPPNNLARKLSMSRGKGPDLEKLLAKADAELEKLADSYTEWVQDDVVALVRSLAAARTDTDRKAAHLEELYTVAHDMKGQGGTFGYGLVTQIGRSLCHFIDSSDDIGDREFQVIEAHIDALRVVVREAVQGDGGEIGRQIVAGLGQAVERVLK